MERKKRDLIGISGAHYEYVTPNNSDFTAFFDLLRSQGRRSELIDEKFTPERLAQFSAILIGVPQNSFTKDETAMLRDWVEAGGHLLLLSTMGGDETPTGYDNISQTNLSHLTWNINFDNNCLGILGKDSNYQRSPYYEPVDGLSLDALLNAEVEIDTTSLFNHKVTISYEVGCTLSIYDPPVKSLGDSLVIDTDALKITHALRVPDNAIALSGTARLFNFDNAEIFGFTYESDIADRYIFLRIQRGQGSLSMLGSAKMFSNESINHNDNIEFLNLLFSLWLPNLTEQEIQQRMRGPQRHRLLHGYPMSPLMKPITEESRSDIEQLHLKLLADLNRKFIVGVLPHPFCNPSVKGCGFCTFPHEVFTNTKADHIVKEVIKEIDHFFARNSTLKNIDVAALYFGGGTANLTPPALFRELCHTLNQHIDLSRSEVTLEGVPIYFITQKTTMLEILRSAMPVRQLRISMGVQTFNNRQLQRMGRKAFGDREKIAEVVKRAHSLDYIVSGDLLFNLPEQSLAEMKEDIDTAIDMGFDQICMYHLVMFKGLGTEWSMDDQLLAELPTNDSASNNWLALREYLISKGYRQNSLTNFERADISAGSCRFIYEDCGYRPEQYDLLGFGPSAITLIADKNFQTALKVINPETSADYLELINSDQCWNRAFMYSIRDMKILYLTRKVVLLALNRAEYRAIFHQDPLYDFPLEFEALIKAALIEIDDNEIRLTPRGMFYADTIAGIFACRQNRLSHFKAITKGIKETPLRPVFLRSIYEDSAFSFM